MKAHILRKGRAWLSGALATGLATLPWVQVMAQTPQIEVIPFTTPAAIVYASAFTPQAVEQISAFDVLRIGDLGDLEPREASVTIGTANAWATADLNSFAARAVTSGQHTALAYAFRELVAHDPQGRGEVTINFVFKGAAASTYGSEDYTSSAGWGVYVGEWSREAELWQDTNNPSNPLVGIRFPAPYDLGHPLFAAGGAETAFVDHGASVRSLIAHGEYIYNETGDRTSVTQDVAASIRVVPGQPYVIGISAVALGNSVAVIDPVITVDSSNPDVTLEFPNTVADPDPKAPLDGFTAEDIQAMGIDPQAFADLGFFAPPTDPPPSDPPPSDPPPSDPPSGDSTPPTTRLTSTPGPNVQGWNNGPVTLMLGAIDNADGSGVKELHVTVDGPSSASRVFPGNATTITIGAEGTSLVTYFAVDNTGNQETPKTLRLQIDRTAPTLSGMPAPGCVLWPPDHRVVDVAMARVTDSLSGATSDPTVTVTSNEPESGLGDDDLAPDVFVTGGDVALRAERAESGNGRVYTMTAVATDAAGNAVSGTATCRVPHDYRSPK